MQQQLIAGEQKLYDHIKSFGLPMHPGGCSVHVFSRYGKYIALIGEKDHYSGNVLEKAHALFPKMAEDPKRWIIIKEGLVGDGNSAEAPQSTTLNKDGMPVLRRKVDLVYFVNISRALPVPLYSTGRMDDPEVQKYIMADSGLSIDHVLGYHINLERSEFERMDKDMGKFAKIYCESYKMKEVDFLRAQQSLNPDIDDIVTASWNRFIKRKFEGILKENPSRDMVLVSVGEQHLPAFLEDIQIAQ